MRSMSSRKSLCEAYLMWCACVSAAREGRMRENERETDKQREIERERERERERKARERKYNERSQYTRRWMKMR